MKNRGKFFASTLILVLAIAAALVLPTPNDWLATGGLALIFAGLWVKLRSEDVVCRLKGLEWDRQSFCRGWFISGSTGSGKTLSGLRALLFQVFRNQSGFGGLCIDDKGTLHETLGEMAAHFGRAKDVILLRVQAGDGGPPACRFNLIGDRTIPAATYARCIVDTASALGQRREQSFFRAAAQIHMAQAIEALIAAEQEVTLANVYHLLTDADYLKDVLAVLECRTEASALVRHFQKFMAQPPEQLAGVMASAGNYLHHFTSPAIAEVFCRDSTFSLAEVDCGKILCLALPQKFQTERRYVGTFLKQLFFLHALRRFDLSREERDARNLLLFLADEAQHFLTVSEDGGLSDHSVVDVVREAGVAFIAATQSSTSLIAVLGAENAKVLMLNLRNRLIFAAADEEDARLSAEFLGKHWKSEYSETSGPGRKSRTRHRREAYRIEPHTLREMRNHECILVHAEKGFRRRMLPPIEPNGKTCGWFRRWWFHR